MWLAVLIVLTTGIWESVCADYGIGGINCWRTIGPYLIRAALFAVPIGIWSMIQIRLAKGSALPSPLFGADFLWLLASFLLWAGLHYAMATRSILETELYGCAALADAVPRPIFATCERIVPGNVFGVVLLVIISYAIALILQRSGFERREASAALGVSGVPHASSRASWPMRMIWRFESMLRGSMPDNVSLTGQARTPLSIVIAFNLVSVLTLVVLLSRSLDAFGLSHSEDTYIDPPTGAKMGVLMSTLWVLLGFLTQKMLRYRRSQSELPHVLSLSRGNFLILFLINCCMFAVFVIGANWAHRRCVAEFERFVEDAWAANPGVAIDFMLPGCGSDVLWLSGYVALAPVLNVIAFRTLRQWYTEAK